uniref:Uncharacterized protein n=1 Tax=Gloeochaete wittrockiana TaxID=38269 RepID=A0A3G1IVT0_9EUKA|nr:hypothetical protein [Gloeochaete wittrockiana]YP_009546094.1 hypothetical protein [Gloeochaete wittrockiana]ASQ40142.1 hypothetical protein [Gloeochaete wittrockiana]ASQ40155.1 hypothetical protein [Gloeochaete wittrockiana]
MHKKQYKFCMFLPLNYNLKFKVIFIIFALVKRIIKLFLYI